MAITFKKNEVKASILGYYYYLRGVEKSGKTTLYYDLINELFNNDQTKGLLMSMGKEDGYKTLPEIQYEVIDDVTDSKGKVVKTGWKVFVELIDDLVAERQTSGIEVIACDTYDELCGLAKNEVVRLSNIETPTKTVKSINSAFGGYSGGFDKFSEIVEGQLHRLRKVGYTLFVISHTKVRTIKEKGMAEDEAYQMLTTNLDSRFDNVVSHKADVIATIQIEKEVDDGHLIGSKRYIYFRESNFVKAGCRFKEIIEKVELSAKNFIDAVEDGIKTSMRTTISATDFDALKKKDEEERQADISIGLEELKEIDKISDETLVDLERNKQIKEVITAKWKEVPKDIKALAKVIMTDNGIDKIGSIETNPTKAMEEILKLIQ